MSLSYRGQIMFLNINHNILSELKYERAENILIWAMTPTHTG